MRRTCYVDLDEAFESGQIESIAVELNYSSQDAKQGRPNPSKIPGGNNLYTNLAKYKSSLRCYAKYRENEAEFNSETAIEIAGLAIKEKLDGKQFELERHLQSELRKDIDQLEIGLEIIDQGWSEASNPVLSIFSLATVRGRLSLSS